MLYVFLAVAYIIGVRVAFGYHLRKWDEGRSASMAEAYQKWNWSSTVTLETSLLFPIVIPIQVFLFLTSSVANVSFHLTDRWETSQLQKMRQRLQIKKEMEQIQRELDIEISNPPKELNA